MLSHNIMPCYTITPDSDITTPLSCHTLSACHNITPWYSAISYHQVMTYPLALIYHHSVSHCLIWLWLSSCCWLEVLAFLWSHLPMTHSRLSHPSFLFMFQQGHLSIMIFMAELLLPFLLDWNVTERGNHIYLPTLFKLISYLMYHRWLKNNHWTKFCLMR